MRKIFTLLIVAILATATSWAATTGTITFGTNKVIPGKSPLLAQLLLLNSQHTVRLVLARSLLLLSLLPLLSQKK